MPLKLNVGLSQKVADQNYGSRGASVNIELELESTLVTDPAKLQERIRQAFTVVRTSLAEELHGTGNGQMSGANPVNGRATPQTNNGRPANGTTANNGNQRRATQSQIKAIVAIAKKRQIDVAQFLSQMYHVNRPDELTLKQASQAIDELKADAPEERPS